MLIPWHDSFMSLLFYFFSHIIYEQPLKDVPWSSCPWKVDKIIVAIEVAPLCAWTTHFWTKTIKWIISERKVYSNNLNSFFLNFLISICELLDIMLTFLQIINSMRFWSRQRKIKAYVKKYILIYWMLNFRRFQSFERCGYVVFRRKYYAFKITRRCTFFSKIYVPNGAFFQDPYYISYHKYF